MQGKVIDMLCCLPTKEGITLFATGFSSKMGGAYLDLLGRSVAATLGMAADDFIATLRKLPPEKAYELIENEADRFAMPIDRFVELLDDCEVERAVFYTWDEETKTGLAARNDYIAQVVAQYPDRFIGFAGADPHKGMTGVRDLERAVMQLGLKGLALRPFIHEMYANDARFYPLYAKCAELDIPVWLHCSINFSRVAMDFGRPIYVDKVACDFPELRIIMGHGGWPWVAEAVAVAWKNPNVYVDISFTRPRYIDTSGWAPLVQYGNTVIQDKVLFASAWLMIGMPLKEVIRELRELPLKENVKQKWLYDNAACLLRL